jgi:2-C-methyl-D-erythritol 4-phosphate cytidylyltransferase
MTGAIVIVPAAGSGTRFGGDLPKQFRELGGKPIVQHVIERFLLDGRVARVIVPVAEQLLAVVNRGSSERVEFVAGGATRQQSVRRGLDAVPDGFEIVAVHDAVRPFFAAETFHKLLDLAAESGAAFPGLPVIDTIHVVDGDRITATPDRRQLFTAQTPQCFRLEVLREVLARAEENQDDATDEAGLAAKYGHVVRLVAGDPMNFKITQPEDLIVAERVFERLGSR